MRRQHRSKTTWPSTWADRDRPERRGISAWSRSTETRPLARVVPSRIGATNASTRRDTSSLIRASRIDEFFPSRSSGSPFESREQDLRFEADVPLVQRRADRVDEDLPSSGPEDDRRWAELASRKRRPRAGRTRLPPRPSSWVRARTRPARSGTSELAPRAWPQARPAAGARSVIAAKSGASCPWTSNRRPPVGSSSRPDAVQPPKGEAARQSVSSIRSIRPVE